MGAGWYGWVWVGAGGVWKVYGRCSGGIQEVCHPHNGFIYISTIRTEKEEEEEKKVGYRSRRITVFGDLKTTVSAIFSFTWFFRILVPSSH